MGKYDSLRDHLRGLTAFEWNATFAEIERVLGFALPNSATVHRSWWSNSGGLQVHQNAWIKAGWSVSSVDLSRRIITFQRTRQPSTEAPARTPRRQAVAPSSGDMSAVTIRLQWTALGEIRPGGNARPDRPDIPASPGLFRLTFVEPQGIRLMIGAALDLADRFAGRSADAAGRALETALGAGDAVGIEIVLADNAWVLRDGRGRPARLEDPVERDLVTAAALVDARARGLEAAPAGL